MNSWIFSIAIIVGSLFSGGAYSMCTAEPAFYHKDKGIWYYSHTKVEGADAESFHILYGSYLANPCVRDSDYAADKFHVYKESTLIPNADPATFLFLTHGYSHDKMHVYYNGVVLEDADPATFSLLDGNSFPGVPLSRDERKVFYEASAVREANPKDIKLLGRWYWTSNQIVFFKGRPLAQADISTFSVPRDGIAFSGEDKFHYFQDRQVLNKSECRQIGEIVIACKDYVSSLGKKYSGLDTASLHYLGRFPTSCSVIKNGINLMDYYIKDSLIYQDKHTMYEISGDGRINKFADFRPERRFTSLDRDLEDRLCKRSETRALKLIDNP